MPHPNLIDLYSDTQTRPTAGMRKAMAEAPVGDEQKGEDPTTRALEERVAALLGKEAAVFLPSGTMCNQIAILVHCRPGDEVIAPEVAHILNFEAAGGAALAGAQSRTVPAERGIFTAAAVTAALRDPAFRHHPRSRLVALEQTANLGGGAVWPMAAIESVSKAARAAGLAVHMDGARILNAVAASGVPASRMGAHVDSLWLDLSKGLGCPVGAVLAGSTDFIGEAWWWKHRLGGAMRQSGILAAAGLYALDHHVERLAEDHANARRFARLAAEIPGVDLVYGEPETNIVFLDVSGTGRSAAEVSAALMKKGVRIGGSLSGGRMRALTHLDVGLADVETAARRLREVVAGNPKS
jgi:threonine aldolase